MSDNNVQNNKVFNKTEIINAIKSGFATTVKKIFINSLNKEVGFREIKVLEQKQLSRIMIDNESRKDIIYDAQCALINQIKLDEDFDIYDCSEFDKIKLMMALYQSTMFKAESKFTCKECGAENIYKINFNNVVRKLDEFDLSEQIFDYENENWKFKFTIKYPTVKRVSEFYRSYAAKYRKTQQKDIETLNNLIQVDYVNLFIKDITITNKNDNKDTFVDLLQFTTQEVSDLFSSFPQDVIYVDDGVLTYITNNFIMKINECFDKHKCAQCGTISEDVIDKDTGSFL